VYVRDERAGVPGTPAPPTDTGTDELASPMPATVIAVTIAAGQRVTRGDILVRLEAMKMELPIVAPRDGTVGSVTCRAGDLVQPGVPLVVLEPPAAEAS
jgi:biotin carboxyl carrier protein